MSGTVGHKCNQLCVRHDRIVGPQFIERRTNTVHHIQVLDFVSSADVVSLAAFATRQNAANCLAVIGDKQPVTYVLSVSVYGYRLAADRVQNYKRNRSEERRVGKECRCRLGS